MTALRSRLRTRLRADRTSFWSQLATTLERAADDPATCCPCDDGYLCAA